MAFELAWKDDWTSLGTEKVNSMCQSIVVQKSRAYLECDGFMRYGDMGRMGSVLGLKVLCGHKAGEVHLKVLNAMLRSFI